MHPLISVIIPAHNSENTISTAIQSMLNQTYTNIEIIVIDDNSTDNTGSVVKKIAESNPKVQYYKLPYDDPQRVNKKGRNINAGYMARNYGFEKIKGEWITFQDADDASLRNRIEVQYDLAQKYNALHVSVEWQQFKEHYLGKKLNIEKILQEKENVVLYPKEISKLARTTKGVAMYLPQIIRSKISFDVKTKRIINRLFFWKLDSYPASGNCPLFKRHIINKVKFRALPDRVWPSFTGRGADRDFNFQVAETYGNCYVFKLPIYLWRVNRQNAGYEDYGKYVID